MLQYERRGTLVFDIGFAELIIIGVVGLLVIGPERLPGAIRTASLWLNRIKRGFNDIKAEVQQELHNDSVMLELRKTGEQLKKQTEGIGQDIQDATESLSKPAREGSPVADTDDKLPEKNAGTLLPEGATMIATGVASPFLTPFKLTLVAAVFLAIPYVLYQVWSFIAPGMYKHEKRLAIPLLVSSVLLFYAGASFAYFVVFPLIFLFFTSVGPEDITMMTDINSYLDFVLKLFFAFGLAFEIPIAAVLMIWSGITTPEALAKKRPYIIVGCFIFGMLLTPPDIISQALLAIPMWILFEIGVFFGRFIQREDRDTEED
jgi:sec-independent protein translocase protein TatC